MRFLHKTEIDFVAKRNTALVISGVAIAATIAMVLIRGLNFGVDFAGGSEIQLRFDKDVGADTVRATMKELGFKKATVQVFGDASEHEYLVRVERMSLMSQVEHDSIEAKLKEAHGDTVTLAPYDIDKGDALELTSTESLDKGDLETLVDSAGLKVDEVRSSRRGDTNLYTIVLEGVSTRLAAQLDNELGEGSVELRRVEYVGPQVGRELRTRGLFSLVYACLFILLYLAVRFDFRFAPGAVVALAHDAFLTAGFYAISGLEFNLTSIAAILTIIGYSVNDTVVIYDRVRENMARFKGRKLKDLLNQSINETLSRTVITSGTTAVALAGLWFYARGTIWDFAVAMTFGIVVGTYSTIFVASPLVLYIERFGNKAAKSS